MLIDIYTCIIVYDSKDPEKKTWNRAIFLWEYDHMDVQLNQLCRIILYVSETLFEAKLKNQKTSYSGVICTKLKNGSELNSIGLVIHKWKIDT